MQLVGTIYVGLERFGDCKSQGMLRKVRCLDLLVVQGQLNNRVVFASRRTSRGIFIVRSSNKFIEFIEKLYDT